MSAALALADHGFQVALLERDDELGGNLRHLHRTLEGHDPQEYLHETKDRVEKHPLIEVHTQAKIVHSYGQAGRFSTIIEVGDGRGLTLEHGVTILATGAEQAETKEYGWGSSENVMTQLEFEKRLEEGALDSKALGTVAMIQCVGSREEPRNYCSRICCASALKNALSLKERNPDLAVFVFYRDMMAYGFLETFYTEARRKGVVFVQYRADGKPKVEVESGKPVLRAVDPILGREVELRPDILVLSTGMVPAGGDTLARLFGVELNQDGFFQEADSKWRPVDCLKEGVFVAGTAHSPRSIAESVATAQAAAQRALRILSGERVAAGSVVSEVRSSLCSLCERCVEACPYGARWLDEDEGRIEVDDLMCQGCGSCAAVCPNSATLLRGYKDQQVMDIIDAALTEW